MSRTKIKMTSEDYIKLDKRRLRRVKNLLEKVLLNGYLNDEFNQIEEALNDVEEVLKANDGRKK